MWHNVIGQARVKQILLSAVDREKVAGSYLFHGPEGTGKDAAAFEFAKTLNCLDQQQEQISAAFSGPAACDVCENCRAIDTLVSPLLHFVYALAKDVTTEATAKDEDIEIVREQLQAKSEDHYHNLDIPKATSIHVGQIRSLRSQLSRTMSGGRRRVVIISEADTMNSEAQNSLLKTLEEPHENTVIVLTSSNPNRLYSTILSRSQDVRFDPLSSEDITEALIARDEAQQTQAEFLARLSGGSYSNAQSMMTGEDIHEMRKQVVSFLRMGLSRSRKNAIREIDNFLPKSAGLSFLERRAAVEQRLLLLALWMRDALATASGASEHILNVDQKEDLEKFVARFGDIPRILFAIEAVEQAQKHVRQQLQLRPVMIDLILRLEDALVV